MNVDTRFIGSRSRYSDADLFAAIETAAIMVEQFGEPALPLLDRLEQEYHRRTSAANAMSRVAAILQNGQVKMLK